MGHEVEISKNHENSMSGDVWDAENVLGSCAARNISKYMACRDGLAKDSTRRVILFYSPAAKCDISCAEKT